MPPVPVIVRHRPGRRRHGAASALLALLAALAGTGAAAAQATLKLATWNLEWFLTPATFNELKGACTRNDRAHRWQPRSIPCDVAATLERSAIDIGAMARIARVLNA
ncbi:MAG: hypothetical protein KGJ52_08080, partial [Gammaproteobacteria bacterium]|nr:hypothetical protein [Gammaproteobacteria bacterium]